MYLVMPASQAYLGVCGSCQPCLNRKMVYPLVVESIAQVMQHIAGTISIKKMIFHSLPILRWQERAT